MKNLIWLKSENEGYKLHSRSNVTWCEMKIDIDNTLTVVYKDKRFKKSFSSYKIATNVAHTVAERLGIKSRQKLDDGNYNLPGSNWLIHDC